MPGLATLTPRPLSRLAGALGLAAAVSCSRSGGGPMAPPPMPEVPVAVSPTDGATVDSLTPSLLVQNARGFDTGQATYEFDLLDGAGGVLQRVDVPAGATRTEATIPRPLVRGVGYRWKAVGHAADRAVESATSSFEVAVACGAGDGYAQGVVDSFVTACTRRTNRVAFLEPQEVLGAPNARGTSEQSYAGFMSLGQDGYVTVDMGVCVTDGTGADLRVFQYIQSEPVEVQVSGGPAGPWTPLGTKPCGDGGLPERSNHCDFDLAGSGLHTARFVRVLDREDFPCERAGTRTEGADIDAVQVLNARR
jgi:hypothetical protein